VRPPIPRWVHLGALVVLLGVIAWLSPAPDHVTDRDIYEATASHFIVVDCTDLHCFRVLVPWAIGIVPGPSLLKWKAYAVLGNAAAAVAVYQLCLAFGLTRRAAWLASTASAFGFGSLYTLHDVFTADPLMYFLGGFVTLQLLAERVAYSGALAAVGVFAKEFVAAPLFAFSALAAIERRPDLALRTLAAALFAFLVWLALQLTLMLRFNYGYGANPSTDLLGGGYLLPWFEKQSLRGALSALFDVYGVHYILACAGMLWAPNRLKRLALVSIPVALIFAYVQQPDRALWNMHYLMMPLAAVVLARVSNVLAWGTIGAGALANLRVGAQLPLVPARFALGISLVLGCAAIIVARRQQGSSAMPPPGAGGGRDDGSPVQPDVGRTAAASA
jgi:hypothetical protein